MSAAKMVVTTRCDESISLMYQGKFDDAERILASILAKNPGYAPAENNLGNLWLRRGMVEKALPRYRRALEIDSTEGDYHANYGIALFLAGQLAEAKSELLRAKALLPYYLSLDANLAQVNEVADVMKMNPAEGHLVMAENALSINDIDLAIRLFKRSLELSPKSLRALNDLAVAYHRKGRIDDAIGTLEGALKYYPDNTDLLYNKGMMHFEKGERDKAIWYWEEVLRIDPDNEDVRQLLKRVSTGG
jgi:tetratricopeptide (TPR) repeat protein